MDKGIIDTVSLSYYAVGVLSSFMMIALLGAPFFVLLWYLKTTSSSASLRKAKVFQGTTELCQCMNRGPNLGNCRAAILVIGVLCYD